MTFEEDVLQAHNVFRAAHGVPPLTLNPEMTKISQAHADFLLKRDRISYFTYKEYGENLYCFWSKDETLSGARTVKEWYDEIKFYNFNKEPTSLKSGHFTQVIWKYSKELGVGMANAKKRWIVVCHYSPPGNILGRFTDAVPKVKRNIRWRRSTLILEDPYVETKFKCLILKKWFPFCCGLTE